MAKLVEIAAREVQYWPGYKYIAQRADGLLFCTGGGDGAHRIGYSEIADDRSKSVVTRAQWEAERARIERHSALIEASMMELEEAERERQLAESSKFTESDKAHIQELTDIACGKKSACLQMGVENEGLVTINLDECRSWDDLVLWDTTAFRAWEICMQADSSISKTNENAMAAMAHADAFMAEREKRLNGGV